MSTKGDTIYLAHKAVALAKKTGEPLPQVDALKDLYRDGNYLYKGSLTMVAGMPAAYKSMFTLWLVHTMHVPTLFFSADSDAAVQLSRLAAMITLDQSRGIRSAMAETDAGEAYYREALNDTGVQFVFDSNPDAFDIESEINAWVELYDEFPEVIVVDNLRNVYSGQDNEHSGYKTVQQRLIDIARETGACVITMHHMKEGGEGKYKRSSTQPAQRNGIDGMVSQLPDFILSVARDGDQFFASVVKDRNGRDYPEADRVHTLRVDTSTASFYSYQSIQSRIEDEDWTPTKILEK